LFGRRALWHGKFTTGNNCISPLITLTLPDNTNRKMEHQDIRWLQRLSNYKKALSQLEKAVALSHERALSNLEEQGLIQSFEYTQELAWNVMKDYFEYQGNTAITGSRDAIREAFSAGLVTDGDGWMDTIKSRNKSTHTYNQETADEITNLVINLYIGLFRAFSIKMEALRSQLSTQ
jgi:nucleotidyltransferase substrate binding protein (TIGR01987 family)